MLGKSSGAGSFQTTFGNHTSGISSRFLSHGQHHLSNSTESETDGNGNLPCLASGTSQERIIQRQKGTFQRLKDKLTFRQGRVHVLTGVQAVDPSDHEQQNGATVLQDGSPLSPGYSPLELILEDEPELPNSFRSKTVSKQRDKGRERQKENKYNKTRSTSDDFKNASSNLTGDADMKGPPIKVLHNTWVDC